MAKHIHIHTHDYGTSEGAKKRWQKSAGMNTPEAHAKRAQLREQGEHAEGRRRSQEMREWAQRMKASGASKETIAARAQQGGTGRQRTAPKDPTAWNKGNLTPPKYTGGGVGVRGIPEGTYKPTGGYGGGRDSNTADYGTSEGAKKAAETRKRGGGGRSLTITGSRYGQEPERVKTQNVAKQHGFAQAREVGAMQHTGNKSHEMQVHENGSWSHYTKEGGRVGSGGNHSDLKKHLQANPPGGKSSSGPNYSAIEKANAERKRLNETKYKNVSTRPMRNTSKYFFNR